MKGLTLKHEATSVYNFDTLCKVYEVLTQFVVTNSYGTQTIDFGDPKAVKALNTALLFAQGKIHYWDFPDDNLCPPIPGRQSYIDGLAILLEKSGIHKKASILDIGTGATCIYPLLGKTTYDWQFIGTDIDESSLENAQKIIDKNGLQEAITLRHQDDAAQILTGVVAPSDRFTAAICNPPYYKNRKEADSANSRKLKGLKRDSKSVRNFSGSTNELIYKGGEKAFLHNYLYQSSLLKTQCFWYTSLVSNKKNLKSMQDSMKKLNVFDTCVLELHLGNKQTRVLAWTFLNKAEQKVWIQQGNS